MLGVEGGKMLRITLEVLKDLSAGSDEKATTLWDAVTWRVGKRLSDLHASHYTVINRQRVSDLSNDRVDG